jgi:hypothetical protein
MTRIGTCEVASSNYTGSKVSNFLKSESYKHKTQGAPLEAQELGRIGSRIDLLTPQLK